MLDLDDELENSFQDLDFGPAGPEFGYPDDEFCSSASPNEENFPRVLLERPFWLGRRPPVRRPIPTPDARWQAVDASERRRLRREHPDLAQADKLYRGDWRTRAELEARALANQPTAEIANVMRLPVGVLKAYEEWFFNIRPHLSNQLRIYRLLGRRRSARLSRRKVPFCWKWAAYEYGLPMLEQLLTAVDRRTLIQHGVDAYWQAGAKLDVEYKARIALKRLPAPSVGGCSRLEQRILTAISELSRPSRSPTPK